MENRHDKHKSPALVIYIQSWATLVIGAAMLVVGLLAGYFLRPVITDGLALEQEPRPQATVAVENNAAPAEQEVPNAISADALAGIVSLTRHYRGEADAPITIIEFSDFQ